jgi:Cu(I)/Ag(I) efflux system membrane fusion protein
VRAARSGLSADPSGRIGAVMDETARAADTLGQARDLEKARAAFGEVSRLLMILANCDPRLAEGWHVFSCPMAKGFNKWMQPSGQLENPYMGQAMPTCGSPADWSVSGPRTAAEVEAHAQSAHGTDGSEVAYYTCSMHPSVREAGPGTCPICSMDLVPVTRQEAQTGVVFVDAQRRQAIGVRTEPVRQRLLTATIRAVGQVAYDQTRLRDVSVKYKGWIANLVADKPGQAVRKGQVLFTLYSPELLAAQEEMLSALASQRDAAGTSAPDRADYLVRAARQRLRLWDLTEAQVDRIARTGQAVENVPIVSPVSGYLVEKNVVDGAAVESGMKLLRIAGLDRVWIEAEVYESELPLVKVGQAARVSLPYAPHRYFPGRIAFIYPYVDASTRTGRVRVELANPGLELKPEMYANVELQRELGYRLAVPEPAVLYAGERRFVFVDLGEGRLRPQEVELGARAGDHFEVLKGVKEGDVIVTSGNFLIAAESRLKLAMDQWK